MSEPTQVIVYRSAFEAYQNDFWFNQHPDWVCWFIIAVVAIPVLVLMYNYLERKFR